MKTEQNVYSSMDDIIFENRNKEYGAYALRKTYSDNVMRAAMLVFGSSIILVAFSFVKRDQPLPTLPDVPDIVSLGHEVDIIKIPEVLPPRTEVRRAPANLAPTPVQEEIVEVDIPPTDELVEGSPTGTETGTDITGGTETGTAVAAVEPEVVTPPKVWNGSEIMPSYVGGMESMMRYMQKSIRYPAIARRMGIQGTVYVSFIVDMNGNIIETAVVKGISKECDAEALRVISKMPVWNPGKQGGVPVMVRMVLPIRFRLNE